MNSFLQNTQTGFSLVEVIVAVAITGLGLLGVAAAMRQSLRQEIVPEQNLQALALAQTLAEMVRVNPASISVYRDEVVRDRSNEFGGISPWCEVQESIKDPGQFASIAECTPDQYARYAGYRWGQQARELRTIIREQTKIEKLKCGDRAYLEPNRYRVILQWKDDVARINSRLIPLSASSDISGCQGLGVTDPLVRCLVLPFDVPSQIASSDCP